MHKFFVYLIVSENRLVILKEEVKDPDYFELLNNIGSDAHQLEYQCKTFCLGFILGGEYGQKVVNNLHEFK